jgi:hypothetical protein
MLEFSKTVKMNTLISTSTSYYIIIQLICLMNWSFLKDLLPNETYNVDNIKYTNFIFNFCWSQQKNKTIKFISSYFSYNYRLYLYNDFKIYYPLSQIGTTRGNMLVNYLILNACVKTTEMFICEKILTTSSYGNQIYFETIHWRWHTSKCCINISLLKYNNLPSINIAGPESWGHSRTAFTNILFMSISC